MNTVQCVKDFTLAFDQEWHEKPTLPSDRTALLRIQLIAEEAGELVHALAAKDPVEVLDALTDLQYVIDGTYGAYGFEHMYECISFAGEDYSKIPSWEDLPLDGQLDTLGDLNQSLSRLCWTLAEAHQAGEPSEHIGEALNLTNTSLQAAYWNFGMYLLKGRAFEEVHESNMSKLGSDGKPIIDPAGRVVKGPNYHKPDLNAVWEAHLVNAA